MVEEIYHEVDLNDLEGMEEFITVFFLFDSILETNQAPPYMMFQLFKRIQSEGLT
ncbi:MAG: hypothetical protein R6U61_02650 [Thermoplasmata archaeon]